MRDRRLVRLWKEGCWISSAFRIGHSSWASSGKAKRYLGSEEISSMATSALLGLVGAMCHGVIFIPLERSSYLTAKLSCVLFLVCLEANVDA